MILLCYAKKLIEHLNNFLKFAKLVKGQNCNLNTFFLDLSINITNKIIIVIIMSKIY